MRKRSRIRLTIGQKGSDVGSIARPHFTANGATLHIHCHANDHLLEIGSVILIVTALTDRLSTTAFNDPQRPDMLECGGGEGRATGTLGYLSVRLDELIFDHLPPPFA